MLVFSIMGMFEGYRLGVSEGRKSEHISLDSSWVSSWAPEAGYQEAPTASTYTTHKQALLQNVNYSFLFYVMSI